MYGCSDGGQKEIKCGLTCCTDSGYAYWLSVCERCH